MANTLRFKRGLVSTIPTAALGEPLFTTDTFDLYIGNGTTNTRFQKYIASGTTSQLLRGDGSLLTMPIVLTSPANGQVLKYDGTNWVNSADAGVTGSGTAGQVTYWGSASTITGSNNLFWDATNNRLGILTNTPTTSFHINSSTSTQGGAIFGKGGYNYATVSQVDSAADAIFGGGVIASATSGQVAKSVGDVGHYIKIQIGDGISFHTNITGTTGTSFARTINERARFTLGGNFLLGSTSDSGERLQVNGTMRVSGASTMSAGATISNNSNNVVQITQNASSLSNNVYALDVNSSAHTANMSVSGAFIARVNSGVGLVVNGLGNVGIGIAVPAYKLDVQGTLGVTGAATFSSSVGIGTSTMTYLFNVVNSGASYVAGFRGGSNSYIVVGDTSLGGESGINLRNSTGQTFITQSGAIFEIGTFTGVNVIRFATGGTEAARITATNRNFHIGTFSSDTGEKLQVNGTMRVSGTSTFGGSIALNATTLDINPASGNPNIPFRTGNTFRGYIEGNASGLSFGAGASAAICFTLANSGAATFSSSVTATGGITSSAFTRVNLNGSDSIGAGAFTALYNTAFTTAMLQQLNANNGLDWWSLASSVWTKRMTLTNDGNLGLGVTPSAWGATWRALELQYSSGGQAIAAYYPAIIANAYNTGGGFFYKETSQASYYQQIIGQHRWFNAPSGTAGNAITFTQAMTLFASGNLAIGTTTDAGFKLDVNGTMRVSGASTFGDNVTLNGGVITFGAGVSNSPYTNSSWIRGASGAGTFIVSNNIGSWIGLKSNGDLDYNGGFIVSASTGAATFSSSVGVGASPTAGISLYVNRNISGAATSFGIVQEGTIQSTVSNYYGYSNQLKTAAATYTITNAYHYFAAQSALGAGSTITNQYGFVADVTMANGTNNYAFVGGINNASGSWNIFMNGSAPNYMNGDLLLGSFTNTNEKLQVNGTAKITSKLSMGAGTTSNAQINLASSTAPTSPNNGDIWFDGTDLKMRIGGVTKTFTLV